MQLQTLAVAAHVVAVLLRQLRRQRVGADAELPEVEERLALDAEGDP